MALGGTHPVQMHHGDVMGPLPLTIQITRRASRDIGEDRADLPEICERFCLMSELYGYVDTKSKNHEGIVLRPSVIRQSILPRN